MAREKEITKRQSRVILTWYPQADGRHHRMGFPNLTAAHYFMNRESIEITSSKYKLERVETVETIEVLASSGTWTKKNDEIVEKNRISV